MDSKTLCSAEGNCGRVIIHCGFVTGSDPYLKKAHLCSHFKGYNHHCAHSAMRLSHVCEAIQPLDGASWSLIGLIGTDLCFSFATARFSDLLTNLHNLSSKTSTVFKTSVSCSLVVSSLTCWLHCSPELSEVLLCWSVSIISQKTGWNELIVRTEGSLCIYMCVCSDSGPQNHFVQPWTRHILIISFQCFQLPTCCTLFGNCTKQRPPNKCLSGRGWHLIKKASGCMATNGTSPQNAGIMFLSWC